MNEELEGIGQQLKRVWDLFREPIFAANGSKISVLSLTISVAAIVAAVFVSRIVGRMVNRKLEQHGVDSGVRGSLEKFCRYGFVAVAVMFSLDNLGISINSLAAVGAVLMVGIGFGLQNIAQNFISGIIILIERPVKIGDVIRAGEVVGKVMDIRVRSTVVQTGDGITIIVPNSKIVTEDVVNESYSGRRVQRHVKVGVAYGSDTKKVMELLVKAAKGHPRVLPDPAPGATFENFGASSLDFDLGFWVADSWGVGGVASDIRLAIDAAFRAEGIEIPFPQQDVHIRSAPGKNT